MPLMYIPLSEAGYVNDTDMIGYAMMISIYDTIACYQYMVYTLHCNTCCITDCITGLLQHCCITGCTAWMMPARLST